jgi:hypothetical protein
MFPILMNSREREELKGYNVPKGLPIAFVNQFRGQIEKNHGQTIERLAQRGGLHPREVCAAMYGFDLTVYFGKDRPHLNNEQTVFSITLINKKLMDYEKRETT